MLLDIPQWANNVMSKVKKDNIEITKYREEPKTEITKCKEEIKKKKG